MSTFSIISARGDTLALTEDKDFKLINIDAQTSAHADVYSVVVGGMDGDVVNNVQTQARTIILDLRIVGNVELTKRRILDVVKIKQRATLRWEQENRVRDISGYVEAIDMPRWNNAVTLQITLHCAQPYWEDAEAVVQEISEFIGLHYFTESAFDMLFFPEEGIPLGEYDISRFRTYHNSGDVDVGAEIEIIALDTVTNPLITSDGGEFFGVGYGEDAKQVVMQSGDILKINTRKNEKAVTLNGASLLNKIKPNSTWLQVKAGDNEFAISSDDESSSNMSFALIFKQRYI